MNGSAFGKVILLGEHAVVYGVPAIVVGINQGASATVSLSKGDKSASELVLHAGDGMTVVGPFLARPTETTDIARAFLSLLDAAGVNQALRVEARSDLPTAAGLGCSAALGVAIARAIAAWKLASEAAPVPADGPVRAREAGPMVGVTMAPGGASAAPPMAPDEAAVDWAMAWERVFHGNPSGVDAAAAARGGCLLYRRDGNHADIEPVALTGSLSLAIGHTGKASSTRAMVDGVARLRETRRELVDSIFERIGTLVPSARRALETGDLTTLGRAMNENQALLEQLQVSTDETATLCRSALEEGALGAKLTGSGGGGCVVALAHHDPEGIVNRWRKAGFRAFSTSVQRRPPHGVDTSMEVRG